MKNLAKLSFILICAYFLVPASEDWMTWKPWLVIYDENGNVTDKLVDTP